jgi:hypothetical protein
MRSRVSTFDRILPLHHAMYQFEDGLAVVARSRLPSPPLAIPRIFLGSSRLLLGGQLFWARRPFSGQGLRRRLTLRVPDIYTSLKFQVETEALISFGEVGEIV